jgi:HEAT repeat protein
MQTRRDAEDLLAVLCSIEAYSLEQLKTVIEELHGDVRNWGEHALQLPEWNRALWVSPLIALLQNAHESARRNIAISLGKLGPAAFPTIIDLAQKAPQDPDLQVAINVVRRMMEDSQSGQLEEHPSA